MLKVDVLEVGLCSRSKKSGNVGLYVGKIRRISEVAAPSYRVTWLILQDGAPGCRLGLWWPPCWLVCGDVSSQSTGVRLLLLSDLRLHSWVHEDKPFSMNSEIRALTGCSTMRLEEFTRLIVGWFDYRVD